MIIQTNGYGKIDASVIPELLDHLSAQWGINIEYDTFESPDGMATLEIKEAKPEKFWSMGKDYIKPICSGCNDRSMCDQVNYDCPKRELTK
jgi:hypothetical protein